MTKNKNLSIIAALSISGVFSLLFLANSDSSNNQTNTSQMISIDLPENLTGITDQSENSDNEIQIQPQRLSSCAMADTIIGKSGIANCSP